jgi:hypothetical protein
MITVKATREGLIGQRTASGYVIDDVVPFVALPSSLALGRLVSLTNALTGSSCYAFVLDVGPWNTQDNSYVLNGARPQAESGTDMTGRATNGAGIDLGEKVWYLLGMRDNSDVSWEFV